MQIKFKVTRELPNQDYEIEYFSTLSEVCSYLGINKKKYYNFIQGKNDKCTRKSTQVLHGVTVERLRLMIKTEDDKYVKCQRNLEEEFENLEVLYRKTSTPTKKCEIPPQIEEQYCKDEKNH